jgi:hypothetical protein
MKKKSTIVFCVYKYFDICKSINTKVADKLVETMIMFRLFKNIWR